MERPWPSWAWDGLESLRPWLTRTMSRSCRDADELDDVVQETIVRAARYRASDRDPERLRSWSVRVARNVQRDRRRRETLQRTVPEGAALVEHVAAPDATPWNAANDDPGYECAGWFVDSEQALGHLESALAALDPGDRVVLRSFYTDRGATERTAAALGVERHLFKTRLYRARRRLKRALRRQLSLHARERVATGSVVS